MYGVDGCRCYSQDKRTRLPEATFPTRLFPVHSRCSFDVQPMGVYRPSLKRSIEKTKAPKLHNYTITQPHQNQKMPCTQSLWSSPSLASFHVVHVQRIAYLTLFRFSCSSPRRESSSTPALVLFCYSPSG